MAETEKTEGQETQTPESSEDEDAFWKRFDERIDAGVDRAIGKYNKQRPAGQSRTGRSTLPSILAGIIYGQTRND